MHYLLHSFRDTAAGARGSFSQAERREEGGGGGENGEKSLSRMETCCHIEMHAFVSGAELLGKVVGYRRPFWCSKN